MRRGRGSAHSGATRARIHVEDPDCRSGTRSEARVRTRATNSATANRRVSMSWVACALTTRLQRPRGALQPGEVGGPERPDPEPVARAEVLPHRHPAHAPVPVASAVSKLTAHFSPPTCTTFRAAAPLGGRQLALPCGAVAIPTRARTARLIGSDRAAHAAITRAKSASGEVAAPGAAPRGMRIVELLGFVVLSRIGCRPPKPKVTGSTPVGHTSSHVPVSPRWPSHPWNPRDSAESPFAAILLNVAAAAVSDRPIRGKASTTAPHEPHRHPCAFAIRISHFPLAYRRGLLSDPTNSSDRTNNSERGVALSMGKFPGRRLF